ncbi:MAG TPA: GNAT family N-acetyltransferase [Saprospiraceae bacterium]|nr:GNAT family N-acetyltransferase [Saprospiraceae bacterium]
MIFCKSLELGQKDISISRNEALNYSFTSDFEKIKYDWHKLENHDLLTSEDYLQALKSNLSSDIQVYFGMIYSESEPIMGVVYNLKQISLTEAIREEGTHEKQSFLKQYLRQFLEKFSNIYTLVTGNLYITGEYGYACSRHWNKLEILQALNQASKEMTVWLKQNENINVGIYLFKDFYASNLDVQIAKKECQLTKFRVQPNMIMGIDSNWSSMEDYLSAIKSKYRVRYRRSRKAMGEIEIVELSEDQLVEYQDKVYNLYHQVSENAGFNLFELSQDYFIQLKRSLKQNFRVYAYFLRGEMVAFYSVILNNPELEAHFLGYEGALNHDFHIYQNMLYDIIGIGIAEKMSKINFSRTALEIKSSVGAVPFEMDLYMRHKNPILNWFLSPLIKYMTPKYQLVERNPFG